MIPAVAPEVKKGRKTSFRWVRRAWGGRSGRPQNDRPTFDRRLERLDGRVDPGRELRFLSIVHFAPLQLGGERTGGTWGFSLYNSRGGFLSSARRFLHFPNHRGRDSSSFRKPESVGWRVSFDNQIKLLTKSVENGIAAHYSSFNS